MSLPFLSLFSLRQRRRAALLACGSLAVLAAAVLPACGGGNPLTNPPDVTNPPGATGQKLSFAYYQKCIQPILEAALAAPDGSNHTNTCASGGCHDNTTGTGGALRVIGGAAAQDLSQTADVLRDTEMYRNFYSAQGVSLPGNADDSRLFDKPLLKNVLHGGGLIFASESDPNALKIRYWIEHPSPQGQDEFSTATYSMFTPADPATGACNTTP